MSEKRRLVQVTISTLDGEDLARTVIGLPGDGFYAALDELQEAVRAGDADSVLVKRGAVFALKALEVATAGANVLARAAKTVGNFTVMGFHGKYSDGYAAALEDVSRYLHGRSQKWPEHIDMTDAEMDAEFERIKAMSKEKIRELGIAEYGSEEAWRAAAAAGRQRLVEFVEKHIAKRRGGKS